MRPSYSYTDQKVRLVLCHSSRIVISELVVPEATVMLLRAGLVDLTPEVSNFDLIPAIHHLYYAEDKELTILTSAGVSLKVIARR